MAVTPAPSVPARLTDLLRDAPAGQGGALWRLDAEGRQLDANLVRLAPGASIAAHVEPDFDVLVYVAAGSGWVESGRQELRPGSLLWMPRGAERAIHAGADGLAYLTVHRRRPAMAVRAVTPQPQGGEPACALNRVCQECGRLAAESDARYCGRCGSRLPTD